MYIKKNFFFAQNLCTRCKAPEHLQKNVLDSVIGSAVILDTKYTKKFLCGF